MLRAILLFTLLQGVVINYVVSQENHLPPSCQDEIYCNGRLLHTIQMASVFPDSKTFVDMKLKYNSDHTLLAFDKLMGETEENPSYDDLKKFLKEYFEPAGSEFETWEPSDWRESPKFLEKVRDRALKHWANELHFLWKFLGRKIKHDVEVNSNLYSIISVPNPVIVPGGRFREFYYWDSYWIVRGLLVSEMRETVKGMLGNFISIVEKYGFVPNGGRKYYLSRSQPPLLIPMVDSYLEFTKDYEFVKTNLKFLEKEFQFWLNNRAVNVTEDGKTYIMFRYNDESTGPRPESYREDTLTAEFLDEKEKEALYSQLKTSAESGWDFSTRWFISSIDGSNNGNLTDIKIKSIIPVDLNSIMYGNAKILANFFRSFNQLEKGQFYEQFANDLLEAISQVLWHPKVGVWLDYDLKNGRKREFFYPSNFAPLWTNCYDKSKVDYYVENVITYLHKNKALNYLGGIPTSLFHSGEQWDYPNAWPPIQHMVIIGLYQTNNSHAKDIAINLAEKWIQSNYRAYQATKAMYEKYDATISGGHGGGGEYEVQLGFGWTNGVILDLLDIFGEQTIAGHGFNLTINPVTTNHGTIISAHHFGPAFTLILAFSATLTAAFIGTVVYAKRHSPKRPDKSKYTKIPGEPNL